MTKHTSEAQAKHTPGPKGRSNTMENKQENEIRFDVKNMCLCLSAEFSTLSKRSEGIESWQELQRLVFDLSTSIVRYSCALGALAETHKLPL